MNEDYYASMDMIGNTKEKEKKKKRRKRNWKCYYEDLTPSWQRSINALLASFVFFCVGENISFVLEKVYLL